MPQSLVGLRVKFLEGAVIFYGPVRLTHLARLLFLLTFNPFRNLLPAHAVPQSCALYAVPRSDQKNPVDLRHKGGE